MLRTLTQKVTFFALIGTLLFLVVAVFVIRGIMIVRDAANYDSNVTSAQIELSGQFNTDMFRGFAEGLSYARTREPENRESALQEMHDASEILVQLETLENTPNPYDAELGPAHAQLQMHRAAVFNSFQPTVLALVRAVDANNDRDIAVALDVLNQHKLDIETLEEDSGELAERSMEASSGAIAASVRSALISAGASAGVFVLLIPLILLLLRRRIVQPIKGLAKAAEGIAAGNLNVVIPVTTSDEIGELQATFNQMAGQLAVAQAEVAEQRRTLEDRVVTRTADLERALAELRAAVDAREQLNETVRALGSPVVPVLEGILVMPLIGVIDAARATVLIESLLSAIERHRANIVIIDATGVPIVDTEVAQVLLHAAQASKLLGAQTMLVGLRPELAQTIVGLGMDLMGLVTRSDLQSGILYAMNSQRGLMAAGVKSA
jgi:rsbT co-antagonist protein RsbR